jgi:hypothetical protein
MKKILPALALSLSLLAGCSSVDTDLEMRTASHIARPAFMSDRFIDAGMFSLRAWERMHAPGQPATIYIEDDGEHILKAPALEAGLEINPTPDSPIALHLASRDLSKNVGYLARPCQFIKNPTDKGCEPKYWQDHEYTPEVFNAYKAALDDMALRYDLSGFHLVGHGGGANIAAVLAATRDDVLSLRTVAGDLSPAYTRNYHGSPALAENSLLAVDYGTDLAYVPQHHYIGAADKIIPPGTFHSYRQAIGISECLDYTLIQDADHRLGWVQIWPELLAEMPECAVVFEELPALPPAPEFPGDYYKEPRLK